MKEKRKYADRSEYIKKAVAKRRKKIKDMAIEYKGGKFILCGYDKCKDALQFHHLNSEKKEFGVAQSGLTRSWERVKNEIENAF